MTKDVDTVDFELSDDDPVINMLAKMTMTPEHVSVCEEEQAQEDFDIIDQLDVDHMRQAW